jgi:hypothetical protein
MIKILGILIAAIAIAVSGFFGFEFYVQQRIASDVEASFKAVRDSGAKASHGKVSFDLWSRTITVSDIAGESAAQPPVTVKIARFMAEGVNQQETGRFSASRVEATDVDVAGTMAQQSQLRFAYRAPRIEVVNYAGPAGPLRQFDPAKPADIHRFVLEHFAAVTAASVTAPTVAGSMTAPAESAAGLGDYTYSGLAMRDIRDGKIAAITIDRVAFATTLQTAGKPEKMTGEVADLAAADVDAAAALAMFDPARASDDKYYRVYRQMKTGAYTASFAKGLRFRIDGMAADEIGIKPSKLQLPQLMAIVESMPAPGKTPTPAQTRDMLDKVAVLYEGVQLGSAEVRGFSMDVPEGAVRLAAVRLTNLTNGKLAEFAFEGLEAPSPQGPVKIGRFALKALDVANLMRMSGQFSTPGREPSPDQLAALLLLLEGTEIRGLVAPYKNSRQPVNLDTLNLSWGQFVGPIPTRARATVKMSGPVDLSDPDPFRMLAAAGMNEATANLDFGAAWNEGAKSFALEPISFEVGSVMSVAARVTLANVPREVFSINPLQATIMAAQIEAGTIEIALRDTGGIDLALTQRAKLQNLTREAARKALVDTIRENAMKMATVNPDVMALAGTLIRFIENPRGTLTVKLTPRGKVAMLGLVDTLRTNPLAALARFQVEASAGR